MKSKETQKLIEQFLEDDDWYYQKKIDEGNPNIAIYDMTVELDNRICNVDMKIMVRDDRIESVAYFPIRVGNERKLEVCEFITRINYEYLMDAIFEMDFDAGKIRAIWSYDTSSGPYITKEFASDIVTLPLKRINEYGEDLLDVIYGNSARVQFKKIKVCESGIEWPEGTNKGQPFTFFINLKEEQ